jgi:hypothetical protein
MIHSRTVKLIVAFAVATIAACVTTFVTTMAIVSLDSGNYIVGLFAGSIGAYFALLAFPPFFAVMGLPLYALSVRQGWTWLGAHCAVGLIVSGLSAGVSRLTLDGPHFLMTPAIILGGTAATLAFWSIARPDRRATEMPR